MNNKFKEIELQKSINTKKKANGGFEFRCTVRTHNAVPYSYIKFVLHMSWF